MQPQRRQPTRLLCPWDSPGKNTGVSCHFLLQCVKVKSLSHVWLFTNPWTATYQAPLSMGFSRQEYWNGLPFPSPGPIGEVSANSKTSYFLCGGPCQLDTQGSVLLCVEYAACLACCSLWTYWSTKQVPSQCLENPILFSSISGLCVAKAQYALPNLKILKQFIYPFGDCLFLPESSLRLYHMKSHSELRIWTHKWKYSFSILQLVGLGKKTLGESDYLNYY